MLCAVSYNAAYRSYKIQCLCPSLPANHINIRIKHIQKYVIRYTCVWAPGHSKLKYPNFYKSSCATAAVVTGSSPVTPWRRSEPFGASSPSSACICSGWLRALCVRCSRSSYSPAVEILAPRLRRRCQHLRSNMPPCKSSMRPVPRWRDAPFRTCSCSHLPWLLF